MSTVPIQQVNKRLQSIASVIGSHEEGQGLVEYALIIALVAVLLAAALTAVSGGISSTFSSITTSL